MNFQNELFRKKTLVFFKFQLLSIYKQQNSLSSSYYVQVMDCYSDYFSGIGRRRCLYCFSYLKRFFYLDWESRIRKLRIICWNVCWNLGDYASETFYSQFHDFDNFIQSFRCIFFGALELILAVSMECYRGFSIFVCSLTANDLSLFTC